MKKLIVILLAIGFQGYPQDSRLLEQTWYLHDLVINGTSNVPPVNNEIPFVPADFYADGVLYTGMCKEGGAGQLEYSGATEFELLDIAFLTGGCHQNHPYNQQYSGLYQSFWGSLYEEAIPYEIFENGTYRTLTITNPNGNYALFANEVPLSISDNPIPQFLIVPTLVESTFTVHSVSNIEIQKITIYNIYGQITYSTNRHQTKIDVSHLPAGVYFVSLEDTVHRITTIKIVKR